MHAANSTQGEYVLRIEAVDLALAIYKPVDIGGIRAEFEMDSRYPTEPATGQGYVTSLSRKNPAGCTSVLAARGPRAALIDANVVRPRLEGRGRPVGRNGRLCRFLS